MAASLRPRRGKRSTAISKGIILKRGEIFFEVPDAGVGTGDGKIVMGDGTTAYEDLPYFSGGSGEGTVRSVNYVDPDASGNVNLTTVPYAENILSSENTEMTDSFVFRTSGGSSDIASGTAFLSRIQGSCIIDEDTGVITVANPTAFKSVGLNQFDVSSMVITGYTIDNTGAVVADASKTIAYVHAVGGLDTGYIAYSAGGYISKIGWCPSIPTTSTTGIITSADTTHVTSVTNDPNSSIICAVEDGYICIVVTTGADLVVHPKWSGTDDTSVAEYSVATINIPTVDINNTTLPTGSYGFPSVKGFADEINFTQKTYTQRIGHYAYSDANLNIVKAMGVDYIYDATHIFYVLPTPIVYTLAAATDGTYAVHDFGTEEFVSSSVNVPIWTTNIYGANLVDKLRRDVVTLSKQTLSSTVKERVRNNLDAAQNHLEFTEAEDQPNSKLLNTIVSGNPMNTIMGANKRLLRRLDAQIASKVSSVNTERPDANGNVNISKVPFADNLYSPDNNESYGAYLYRTSGGTSDLSNGEALLSYIRGTLTVSGRVEENIDCSASSSHAPEPEETYEMINAVIDNATWRASSYAAASGTYEFVYDGSAWKYDSTTVNLATIGITVTGDIFEDDTVTVNFVKEDRGVLHTVKPTAFKSTGLNLFNGTTILSNYTIDNSGNIVSSSGNYVAYCKAPYSDANGYAAFNSANISKAGFCETLPAAGSTVDLTGAVVSATLATIPVPESSVDDHVGYVCVASSSTSSLCIHPRWSGVNDAQTGTYSVSSITMPTVDGDGNDLPYVSYGLPAIGAVADEINFDLKTYTQKIGHYTYSAANLETVKALGVDYEYDTSHIFYILGTPIVKSLASSVSGSYTVNDYGNEYFEYSAGIGGNDVSGAKVIATHLYGQNLRDKLRRDVLTISAQTLSDAQKSQVLSNIGAASAASVTQLNNDLFNSPFNKNNIYRGKYLGTVTSGNVDSFFSQFGISSGAFDDIFVGDCFTIQDGLYNSDWVVAGIDSQFNKGGYSTPGHHIAIIPRYYLSNVNGSGNHVLPMNSTNTTGVSKNTSNPLYATTQGVETAGYQSYYGSDMNQIYLPRILNQLKQVLGNHVITRSELLPNTIADRVSPSLGSVKLSSNWSWYDVGITLMNEVEVYGTIILGNSYDVGIDSQQLPLFKMIPYNYSSRAGFWLRSVASGSYFADATTDGGATYRDASYSYFLRPLLLIK